MTLYNESCQSFLAQVEPESYDLIISDPPYFEITKDNWDNQWSSKEEYIEWSLEHIRLSIDSLKQGGQLYLWGAIGKHGIHPLLEIVLLIEQKLGVTFINWITMTNFRVFGNSKSWPFARQEIVVFSKGKHTTHNKQYSETLGFNRLGDARLVSNVWTDIPEVALTNKPNRHYAEKPIMASERIILASTNERDRVFIPFAGSGVDIEACIRHNRQWDATEINQTYIATMIEPRLRHEVQQALI